MKIVKRKEDPFWAPWFIRWAARLTVRWMVRSEIQGYEVSGKNHNPNAESHHATISCDASFLLHWVLRCCGHEVSPIDIEKHYLKNRRFTFKDEEPWTKWEMARIVLHELNRE